MSNLDSDASGGTTHLIQTINAAEFKIYTPEETIKNIVDRFAPHIPYWNVIGDLQFTLQINKNSHLEPCIFCQGLEKRSTLTGTSVKSCCGPCILYFQQNLKVETILNYMIAHRE